MNMSNFFLNNQTEAMIQKHNGWKNWVKAKEKERRTRDDFEGAVDGGANGELDDISQDLA